MNTFRFDLTNKNKDAFVKGFKTGLIDDIVDVREQKDEWEDMYTVQKGREDRQTIHSSQYHYQTKEEVPRTTIQGRKETTTIFLVFHKTRSQNSTRTTRDVQPMPQRQ